MQRITKCTEISTGKAFTRSGLSKEDTDNKGIQKMMKINKDKKRLTKIRKDIKDKDA